MFLTRMWSGYTRHTLACPPKCVVQTWPPALSSAYVNSSGLGSLVTAHVSRQKLGQQVALSGVNERISKLFEITKLGELFLVFPTLWDAIEALSSSARA